MESTVGSACSHGQPVVQWTTAEQWWWQQEEFSEEGGRVDQVGPPLLLNNPDNFCAGSIARFADAWTKVTDNSWILSNVAGVKIPFESVPIQTREPYPFRMGMDEREILSGEIQKLLYKKVVEQVDDCEGQFVSNVFLRPKPNGEYRIILDLTRLNQCVEYKHFKMFSLQTVLDMMQPGAWLGSVDLKDAYYSVSIDREHRKFLRFRWEGQLYLYMHAKWPSL